MKQPTLSGFRRQSCVNLFNLDVVFDSIRKIRQIRVLKKWRTSGTQIFTDWTD